MYTIRVEHEFAAAHSISIAGAPEPLHGHNWRVRVTIEGPTLDDDALLCDFHTVHGALIDLCAPFHNANLNDTPPFDHLNPSAELVARHIAEALGERLASALAPHARIASVSVTEAPRCEATYFPPAPGAPGGAR